MAALARALLARGNDRQRGCDERRRRAPRRHLHVREAGADPGLAARHDGGRAPGGAAPERRPVPTARRRRRAVRRGRGGASPDGERAHFGQGGHHPVKFSIYSEMQHWGDKSMSQQYWETMEQVVNADRLGYEAYGIIEHFF